MRKINVQSRILHVDWIITTGQWIEKNFWRYLNFKMFIFQTLSVDKNFCLIIYSKNIEKVPKTEDTWDTRNSGPGLGTQCHPGCP